MYMCTNKIKGEREEEGGREREGGRDERKGVTCKE